MISRAHWIRAAAVLALAGCQLPPNLGAAFRQVAFDGLAPTAVSQGVSPATRPASQPASPSVGPSAAPSSSPTGAPAVAATATPVASTRDGGGLDATAALAGIVSRPASDLLISNSTLINTGGAVFFRVLGGGSPAPGSVGMSVAGFPVQSLERVPVGGAAVSLVSLAGVPLGVEAVTTDDAGRFAFVRLPESPGPYVARAAFKLDGRDVVFDSLVQPPASGSAVAHVDVASTFVSRKVGQLAGGNLLDPRSLAQSKILALIELLRDRLTLGHLPFMGGLATDVLPMFDQLALDDDAIRQSAGAVSPAFVRPSQAWSVETLMSSSDVVRVGLIPAEAPPHAKLFGPAGTFAVDAAGDLYLPVLPPPWEGIKVARIRPGSGGAAATFMGIYAELPLGYLNPVSLTFSPQGVLHALAVEAGSLKVRVFSGSGQMQARPGFVYQLSFQSERIEGDPEGVDSRVLGRIAVDEPGNVYVAFPFAHAVGILRAGAEQGSLLAGAMNLPGFQDAVGPEARFRFPFSVAIGPGGGAYVADKDNHCIRRISATGKVETVAGANEDAVDYRNGRGMYARFGGPESLAFGPDGSLFVTDIQTRRVRRLSPDGSVFLVAGTGGPGNDDGAGPDATFFFPRFLTADGAGNLYLLDQEPGMPPPPGPPPPGVDNGAPLPPPPTEFIRRVRRP